MFRRTDDGLVDTQEPPEPAGQPPEPKRPVALFGTAEEKRARFGPPIDPKTLPPRLVSIGRQVRHDPGAANQRGKIVEYEAFINPARPRETWIRFPGEAHPRRYDSHSSDPPPEKLGVIPARPPSGSQHGHAPAKADEKIPMPQPTEEDLRLARSLFGGPTDGRTDPPPRPAFDPVPW